MRCRIESATPPVLGSSSALPALPAALVAGGRAGAPPARCAGAARAAAAAGLGQAAQAVDEDLDAGEDHRVGGALHHRKAGRRSGQGGLGR